MKKNEKLLNELYEYSNILDNEMLAPRGDGAKMAVAQEIHQVALNIFEYIEKSNPKKQHQTGLMLLELVEQILLDKLDQGFTVEEMMNY